MNLVVFTLGDFSPLLGSTAIALEHHALAWFNFRQFWVTLAREIEPSL